MTTAGNGPRNSSGSAEIQRCSATRGRHAVAAQHRLAGLCMVLATLPADAAMICRWVDASGRTQLAEIVPEKYAQSARCTDSKLFEVSAERAEQARQPARTLGQRAGIAIPPAHDPAASAPAAGASVPQAAKRPARGVDQSTDCATWRRLYRESSACFAPYRTVGGTKAEAFEKCTAVPSPEPKCGPPPN